MNGNITWRLVLTILVSAWAVSNLLPLKDTAFRDYVVEAAEAQQEELAALVERAEEAVAADPTETPSVYVALRRIVQEERIDLREFYPGLNPGTKNLDKGNDILLRKLLDDSKASLKPGLDLRGGITFTLAVDESDLSEQQAERASQLEKARDIIASRVDGLGVAEPVIRIKGEDRIEVQMPGLTTRDNPDILDTIIQPARLEFRQVLTSPRPSPFLPEDQRPIGYEVMTLEQEDSRTGEIIEEQYFVKRIPDALGDILASAYVQTGQFGDYQVGFTTTDEGAEIFGELTERLVRERERQPTSYHLLGTVLDGKLYSAATVQARITKSGQITGNFTQLEVFELVNVLNNPLEFGLQIVELGEVSATLAKDSREASILAAQIGGGLVLLFMVLYYRVAGAIAMVTVGLNILLVLGALASFGATITLPGVAALVLTIGMAVDANILIFERIREELAAGKSLHNALLGGYDKAFSTIVDANVTTLITAIILITLGTGPVKGFGVTLTAGILATMFCSLIVSRWILELLVNVSFLKKLLGPQFLKIGEIPFLDYARKAFLGSWMVVALGVVAVFFHWDSMFGIDFIGGDEVTLTYEERIATGDIAAVAALPPEQIESLRASAPADDNPLLASFDAAIATGGFGEVVPLYQQAVGGAGENILKLQTESGKGLAFAHALAQQYPAADLVITGQTAISGSVGEDVTNSAIWSIALALFGMLLYIAIRFEIGYGLGAVTATVHDMLMTVGLFVFLGEFLGLGSGQFTAPMIAAILMTVGYSINDTIVVFDRVREELELNPGANLRRVIHIAINRVLARTVLTSLTTLLATFALYLFGAGVIIDFALVFLIGILTGTFSSVFIASPVFFWYHKGDRKKVEEGHILPSYDWTAETPSSAKPAKAEV